MYWAPLQEQARSLGASLAGRPAAFQGAAPATTLEVSRIELFCCGRVAEEEGDEGVLALDTRRGRYRRLPVRDGRLARAILVGDLRTRGRCGSCWPTATRSPTRCWTPPPRTTTGSLGRRTPS